MEFHCVEMRTFVDSAIIEPTIGINDVAHRVNCRQMNYLRSMKRGRMANDGDIGISGRSRWRW